MNNLFIVKVLLKNCNARYNVEEYGAAAVQYVAVQLQLQHLLYTTSRLSEPYISITVECLCA